MISTGADIERIKVEAVAPEVAIAIQSITELVGKVSQLETLLNDLKGKGAVKCVQRGESKEIVVNISPINPAKSLVVIHNSLSSQAGSSTSTKVWLSRPYELTSNALRLTSNAYTDGSNNNISWQIIEFN